MRELLKKSLDFIKQNPRIIYSLVLVFVIPFAIYLNTFFTVQSFEENLQNIIRSKAVLAEDIVKFIAKNNLENSEELQKLINETKKLNTDIGSFEVLTQNENKNGFLKIASSEKNNIGTEISEEKDIFYHQIAWNQPDNNISFVTSDSSGRIWNVIESIKNDNGEKVGLIFLSFPLKEFDKMNSQTEARSYIILILTILVVLLLVANNARLFGYALTLNKLKEIDKMKDTFVSMASRELRTPLTAMKGNLEFFQEKNKALDKESQHYLENISLSTERLSSLVNDILEVSRLEGNRIPINISAVNPAPIIEQSIEEIKAQATQKGLALEYNLGEMPNINVDSDRLKQILINLLNNSIKYTLSGKISVSTQIKNKEFLITVADTGIGISAEEQANLFHKFYRIQNDKTKNIMGTGLGLWITLELAQKMKGNITVESIEGVGSHFTIHLPLA
jgi:signal transduction histidine kinase